MWGSVAHINDARWRVLNEGQPKQARSQKCEVEEKSEGTPFVVQCWSDRAQYRRRPFDRPSVSGV